MEQHGYTRMMFHDIWVPLGVVLAVTSISLLRAYGRKLVSGKCYTDLRLPPSPPGAWPLLGHLPLMTTPVHRTLKDLAKKYGPIMYMRLGYVPSVVVSSADMLREFFHINDVIMASRPEYSAAEILGFNYQDIVFQPYGDRWRDMRKLFTQELLSMKRLKELQTVRRKEVLFAIQTISYRSKMSAKASVNIRRELRDMTFNNTTQMLTSKRFFEADNESDAQSQDFSDLIDTVLTLAPVFDIGDYIPFLKRFDLFGNIKRMREANARFSRMIDNMFLDHRMGNVHRADGVKDFIDTLLELQQSEKLHEDGMKGMIFDFLVAGTETSSTVSEWLMVDLQLNLHVLKKVQNELDEVVGRDRIVRESDVPNLKYLQACIKESMRLHPTIPLMAAHESTASCTIGGYYIPAKIRVFVNMAAIHWNPATYDEPERFIPERFLATGRNSHVDMKGQHFELIPFGTGRRMCLGMNLGLLMVHLGNAVLLQAYDWKMPEGVTPASLDLSEGFGAVCNMKVPLHLVPTPRLPAHVYAAEGIEM